MIRDILVDDGDAYVTEFDAMRTAAAVMVSDRWMLLGVKFRKRLMNPLPSKPADLFFHVFCHAYPTYGIGFTSLLTSDVRTIREFGKIQSFVEGTRWRFEGKPRETIVPMNLQESA
jgi:hypothetical protein